MNLDENKIKSIVQNEIDNFESKYSKFFMLVSENHRQLCDKIDKLENYMGDERFKKLVKNMSDGRFEKSVKYLSHKRSEKMKKYMNDESFNKMEMGNRQIDNNYDSDVNDIFIIILKLIFFIGYFGIIGLDWYYRK